MPTHDPSASWVITRRSTGEVIGEFYDYRNVLKFNPETCLIEPALAYLQRLNREIRQKATTQRKG